jgi:hypothetical protein
VAIVSRPQRNSILGRRRREGQEVMLAEPSISTAFVYPEIAPAVTDRGKTARQPTNYPDRPMPLDVTRRDRWVRELGGSIIDRTAPVLLDREEVALALDLSPAALDRRIRGGKLALDCATMQGDRELYRREQVRAILLASEVSP